MSVDFTHTDYTDELNRIIVALTGIRDDVRLLRKVMEDPNQGAVTSHVMNDIQKALLAVAISNNGAANAEAIRKQIKEVGIGEVMNTGVGKDSTGTSQENISKVTIGPPPTPGDVDPSISDKRWPPVRARENVALPNANSSSDIFNPATGKIKPLTKDAQKAAMQTSGNKGITPAPAAGNATDINQGERHAILVKLAIPVDDKALMTKVLIRVAGKYYWEVEAGPGPDDGRFGTFPLIPEKYAIDTALGNPLGYQAKTGTADPETGENYGHDTEAQSSLGAVADPRTSGPQ